MSDASRQDQDRPHFDSGYTDRELVRIFRVLSWGADVGSLECYVCEMVIGLSDGDITPLAEGGTVMLHTPRKEIDHRVALVRSAVRDGATFQQAVCALPGE